MTPSGMTVARSSRAVFVLALVGAGLVAQTPPMIAGLAAPGLDARVRGFVLLGELGCVACHAEPAERSLVERREGPDLARVGERVLPGYIERFVADPCAVAPGTTMPDVLRHLESQARRDAAAALAQFLRSLAPTEPPVEATDPAAAARGREVFHTVGCVACHAPRDAQGDEIALAGSVPLGRLEAKYHVAGLRTFLLAPHEAWPAGRMPDMHLTPAEAHDVSHYLLARAPATTAPSPPLDAAKVAAGRAHFATLGCVRCHTSPAVASPVAQPPALRALDPARGCLSAQAGPWPAYPLSDAQRADIRVALQTWADDLSDEARVRQRLAARNCTACHERGEWGGVPDARGRFFTTSEETIGHDGRLPPPLTSVGAKLQPAWLLDAIAFGSRVRPYVRTRMPGFGVACATELAGLLARTDTLPAIELRPLPGDRKQAEAITELGRELVGDRGMACITCHEFAGDRAGVMGAVDLVASTGERLRPEWFHAFLRDPVRFRSGTLMPRFFVDGVSTRPELGGGDVQRQIDAMWHYLAEGRNVRKPSGMRRPPIELAVGDEAVILRRSVQNTGKRGISVGYPGGVNVTFDAESLALNQVWWGGFVDAAPVWRGQGSGEARILGKERVSLPKGPAFVRLHSPTAPWPEVSPGEPGERFLGYDLDAEQRPTFRYACAGATVHDTPSELPGMEGPRPTLQRTLRLTAHDDVTVTFRAAVDARIVAVADGAFHVGRSLRVDVRGAAAVVRNATDADELLVPIEIRGGHAEVTLAYAWREGGK